MSLPPHALARLREVGEPLVAEGGLDALDLGRYELGRELGRGGMGVVYEAHDPELGRRVALKVLSRAAGLSPEARLRFVREARAAAKLTHPNIAAVYDATPEAIAMQLIEGAPLSPSERMDAREAVELLRDAALAVHTAHQQGIVHRDLKPANLMVERRADQRPHVYVMDFGLAKAADLDGSLSAPSGVLGTPHYMAPEQAGAGAVGPWSDVYGLGATLFALLAGRPPFEGDDVYEVLRRTVEEEAPDLCRVAPQVDRDLATVVAKCLRKEPDERYPSALELASDLDRWLRHEPIRARPASAAYRLRKYLSRRRTAVQASLVVGLASAAVVGGILVPRWLSDRRARRSAEAGAELANQVRTALVDAETFLRSGNLDHFHGRLEHGVALCEAFLDRTEIAHAHYFVGRLRRVQQRYDEARDALDRALGLAPDLAGARFERGLVLAILFREAERELLSGPRTAPGVELEELRRRGLADLERGLRDYDVEGSNADHDEIDLRLGRGLAAYLRGDLEQAVKWLEELLQYDTLDVQGNLTLSLVHLRRGDALAAMRRGIRATAVLYGQGPAYRDPDAAAKTRVVQRLLRIEGLDPLLYDFQELVEARPSDMAAFGNTAQIELRNAGRERDPRRRLALLDRAVTNLTNVLTIEPGLATAWNNRGACHAMRVGLLAADETEARAARDRARADLDEALRLDPDCAAAFHNHALLATRDVQLAFLSGRMESALTLREDARANLAAARERIGGAERLLVEGEWEELEALLGGG